MVDTARRRFLRESLATGSVALAAGLGGWSEILSGAAAFPGAPTSRRGAATLLGTMPFMGEQRRAVGQLTDAGLDGRLAFDLETLTEQTLITPSDRFFIRTRYPGGLESRSEPWTVTIRGLVAEPVEISMADLEAQVEPQGTHLLECSGNGRQRAFGLLSAARWDGVPITQVLQRARVRPDATRVLIAGFDEHVDVRSPRSLGASWVFTFEQLESANAFLATRMNDEPLPRDHGFPVRLIAPGWYGCCNAKWVDQIVLVDDSAPSTRQMREFARRTHQDGAPELARAYRPATMDQAAMPVRVEKWRVDDGFEYRVIGVMWGGSRPTDALAIQLGEGAPYVPVQSYDHRTNTTWTLWSHTWKPDAPGRHAIRLAVDDPTVRTRRLDRGSYARSVEIDEV